MGVWNLVLAELSLPALPTRVSFLSVGRMLSAQSSGAGEGLAPEEAGRGRNEGIQADLTVCQGHAQHQQGARGPNLRILAERADGQATEAETSES